MHISFTKIANSTSQLSITKSNRFSIDTIGEKSDIEIQRRRGSAKEDFVLVSFITGSKSLLRKIKC